MLEGSILQQLDAASRQKSRPLNLGVYYKNTLVALCHALEDFVLETDGSPLMLTFFQEGKWYLQEAERYSQLAQKAEHVTIVAAPGSGFAEHPTGSRENVSLVSIDPQDAIAREWHLMILSPTYTAMVLCQELSEADYGEQGMPSEDLERKFYGFWTFELELVLETVEIGIQHVGRYNPTLAEELSRKVAEHTAQMERSQPEDVRAVVARVVNYLKDFQDKLAIPQPDRDFAHTRDLDENLLSNEMQAFLRMAQLIDQADATNPLAAAEVAAIAEAMGQLLDLPAWQVKRLRLAGHLHRLAPLPSTVASSKKSAAQRQAERQDLPRASFVRIMPRLQAIAEIVTHQGERWDGSGQPDGLAYDDIPLESRILGIAIAFQHDLTSYRSRSEDDPIARAIAQSKERSGTAFDPKLVETLEILALGMEQGMTLKVTPPKIASGIWLLDAPAPTQP